MNLKIRWEPSGLALRGLDHSAPNTNREWPGVCGHRNAVRWWWGAFSEFPASPRPTGWWEEEEEKLLVAVSFPDWAGVGVVQVRDASDS